MSALWAVGSPCARNAQLNAKALHVLLNEFSLLPVKLCLGRLPTWALKRLVSLSKLFSWAISTGCAYNKISGEAKWLIHNRFFFF